MGGVMPFIHVYILKLFEDNKTTLAFDYNLLTCVHAPIPKHYDLQTSTPARMLTDQFIISVSALISQQISHMEILK